MPFTRRAFLQTAAASAAPAATRHGPNILFLMADQYRYDCLGANGNRIVHTPNLDRLAAGSVNFGNAFVQSPVCVPSRVSYFTGRYAHSHKNRVNYTPCDPSEVFLQRMLKDAGYQTGCVGKLHYYPPTAEHARSTGYDRVLLHDGVGSTDPHSDYVKWRRTNDPNASVAYSALAKDVAPGKNPFRGAIDYQYTPTHWTGEETCRMLQDFAASPKPFFLLSSFFKPHSPFDTQKPYDTMYDDIKIPLPRRTTLEDIQKLAAAGAEADSARQRAEYLTDPDRLEWMYRSYYAACSMVDYEMGRILDVLEKSETGARHDRDLCDGPWSATAGTRVDGQERLLRVVDARAVSDAVPRSNRSLSPGSVRGDGGCCADAPRILRAADSQTRPGPKLCQVFDAARNGVQRKRHPRSHHWRCAENGVRAGGGNCGHPPSGRQDGPHPEMEAELLSRSR